MPKTSSTRIGQKITVSLPQAGAKEAKRAADVTTINQQSSTFAHLVRRALPAQLAVALRAVRTVTLALFDAYAAADKLHIAYDDTLNPPLWELGHVGWFQEYWISRNAQCHRGAECEPIAINPRAPSILAQADNWYDSSTVNHASRWHLPLLQSAECKAYLAATLAQTLQQLRLLETAGCEDDNALYFYRLVILHEAMHAEAAIYMAQALDMPLGSAYKNTVGVAAPVKTPSQIRVPAQHFALGGHNNAGFSFDNELQAHTVEVAAFTIDAQPITWAQYLAFVEATGRALPRYVRRMTNRYEAIVFGQWQPLVLADVAVHLTWQDAADWCAWSGRRLPTEAEWECAATQNAQFNWGQVWEWTASKFMPYKGFVAHPYLDYSQPWFGSRMVLRGACAATLPMMRDVQYRNYFTPDRNDIYAGFRSCAL